MAYTKEFMLTVDAIKQTIEKELNTKQLPDSGYVFDSDHKGIRIDFQNVRFTLFKHASLVKFSGFFTNEAINTVFYFWGPTSRDCINMFKVKLSKQLRKKVV